MNRPQKSQHNKASGPDRSRFKGPISDANNPVVENASDLVPPSKKTGPPPTPTNQPTENPVATNPPGVSQPEIPSPPVAPSVNSSGVTGEAMPTIDSGAKTLAIPVENTGNQNPIAIQMPKSNSNSVIWAVVILLVAGGGIFAWWSSQQREKGTDNPPPSDQKSAKLDEEINELKEEKKELEGNIESLKRTKSKTNEDVEKLKTKQKELDDEIKKMTETISLLKQFNGADLVMLNPTHYAIGLKYKNGHYEVIASVSNDNAALASRYAFNRGIIRIQNHAALARQIALNTSVGTRISVSHQRQVDEIYNQHRFVPVDPGAKPQWVSYRDRTSKRNNIAFYQKHDQKNLYCIGIDGQPAIVQRERIEPGTAIVGNEDILFGLPEDVNFLDYCTLNIAQKLGTSEGQKSYVNLVIHTDVDIPASMIESARFSAGLMIGGSFFLGFEKTWHDPRVQASRLLVKELEDEFYAQFTGMGIDVLEREEREQVLIERAYNSIVESGSLLPTRQIAQERCATHLVLCETAPTNDRDTLRMSIRLVDLYSGQAIWAATRHCPIHKPVEPDIVQKKWHRATGQLAYINKNNRDIEALKVAKDLPNLLTPIHRLEKITSRVIILEPTLNQDGQVAVRDLFSNNVVWIDAEKIKGNGSGRIHSVNDVPADNRMRYCTWSICNAALPKFGAVMNTQDHSAGINIAGASKLDSQTQFLVLRRHENENGGFKELERLPYFLSLNASDANHGTVFWKKAGAETLWQESTPMKVGDWVYSPDTKAALIAVENTKWRLPPRGSRRWERLGLNNPARRQRVEGDSATVASRIGSKIRTSLTTLEVPNFAPSPNSRSRSRSRSRTRISRLRW